ncbi:transposase [Clostridium sp. SYSU_GA19001]|uniref:transposase n=1 Tax=Clostridium caldaquaticum TaxID=2940653 RepID=UPI00207778CE|nr:transposase [Clostridium caldaquaticum]MCM8711738.1 transposase [Clostridium caldaquaticum]
MPRIARQKKENAIFHVMARSISEVNLFKDNQDKACYLEFVKKYQKTYEFRVYGYCLMDNHLHLIIDTNGTDISRIMHSINFSYAQYFNHKHKRHGHLFQDRFKSKMVKSEVYLYALSAYVHNNPCDIKGFENCPEKYEFSSLPIYLGLRHDPYELIEDGFIMGMFSKNPKKARESYMRLVYKCCDKVFKEEVEFLSEGTEYRSGRKILVRNVKIKEIIEFIALKMEVKKIKLHTKYCREIVEAKALAVLLMRSLCNLKCSEICRVFGNITQSRVSKLSSLGVKLLDEEKYRNITREFMMEYAC